MSSKVFMLGFGFHRFFLWGRSFSLASVANESVIVVCRWRLVFAITVFATLFYGYVLFSRNYGAGLPAGQVFPGFQGRLREEGVPLSGARKPQPPADDTWQEI